MNLSQRLSGMMRRRGIRSQNELARLSGVSQSSIHRMLCCDGYTPTLPTLAKLARALNTSELWLAHGDNGHTGSPAPDMPPLVYAEALKLIRLLHNLPQARQHRIWHYLHRVAHAACPQHGQPDTSIGRYRVGRHWPDADLDT